MPAKIQIQKQREILLFLIKILSFENFFLFLDLVYYRCSCFILNTRLIMNKDLRKVVILLAHPNMKGSQANKALIDAVGDIEGVAVFNLYELSPDIAFNVDEWSKIISDASAVIYQFPFYWMSAPSLLKKWQDEVFTFLSKTPAVAGKPLTVVTTTGSEFDAYRSGGRNGFTTDELLRPYQGSAIHSGMVWQTPIVVYGMGTADAGKNIAEGANTYRQRVEMLVNSSNAGNNW